MTTTSRIPGNPTRPTSPGNPHLVALWVIAVIGLFAGLGTAHTSAVGVALAVTGGVALNAALLFQALRRERQS